MPTPDDLSGGLSDADKLIINPDAGETADAEGEVVYNSGAFEHRDASGVFNPRPDGPTHTGADDLVHDLAESGYEEFIYTGNRLDAVIFWTSVAKTQKIREEQFTYTGQDVTGIVRIQYDAAGAEAHRVTQSGFSYSGGKLQNDTWTRT